ncbi:MAG: hypothetical protein HOW73_21300 [Polyangiaceae bacterium]|nr:hypothetical protein [Polyangiaceae bacterium]
MHSKVPVLLALGSAALLACTVTATTTNRGPDESGDDGAVSKPKPTATAEPTATATSVPTSAPTSAPKMCTKMGCMDGLTIDIDPGKGGTPKGSYTIEVDADGKKATCQIKLPYQGCERGPATKCSGDVKVEVMESGCDKPAKEHTFGPLKFMSAPATVKVVIKKDNKPFAESTVTPDYKTLQPNGPDCDPVCKQGQGKVCAGRGLCN